eukprot:PLAT5006.1.p2 GENE.PLAT5006.1~~PLAT5006.1.p2  ORF type:complete len:189 (+),score=79.53 PLAT5006.1:873-1439(+)
MRACRCAGWPCLFKVGIALLQLVEGKLLRSSLETLAGFLRKSLKQAVARNGNALFQLASRVVCTEEDLHAWQEAFLLSSLQSALDGIPAHQMHPQLDSLADEALQSIRTALSIQSRGLLDDVATMRMKIEAVDRAVETLRAEYVKLAAQLAEVKEELEDALTQKKALSTTLFAVRTAVRLTPTCCLLG